MPDPRFSAKQPQKTPFFSVNTRTEFRRQRVGRCGGGTCADFHSSRFSMEKPVICPSPSVSSSPPTASISNGLKRQERRWTPFRTPTWLGCHYPASMLSGLRQLPPAQGHRSLAGRIRTENRADDGGGCLITGRTTKTAFTCPSPLRRNRIAAIQKDGPDVFWIGLTVVFCGQVGDLFLCVGECLARQPV